MIANLLCIDLHVYQHPANTHVAFIDGDHKRFTELNTSREQSFASQRQGTYNNVVIVFKPIP